LYAKRFGRFVASGEKSAEAGDRVTFDLVYREEKYGKYNKKGIPLRAGDDDFRISQDLVGMKPGDRKEIETFVDGEKVKAFITVTKVESLIPLAFQENEKGREQELRDSIRRLMETAAPARSEQNLINAIMDRLAEKTKVEIPKGFLEKTTETRLERRVALLAGAGFSFGDYLAFSKKTRDDIKREEREQAEKAIVREAITQTILETFASETAVSEERIQTLATEMYRRESENGQTKRSQDDQRQLILSVLRRARDRVTEETVNEFLKKKVTIVALKAAPYEPSDDDFYF
jgi:FKBP-type peptidyl-prolyl cis-trans isomerase (trigger factor)